MAKKKTESDEATPAKKAPAAKKPAAAKKTGAAEAAAAPAAAASKPAAAKKPSKASKPAGAPMQSPLIDTDLAAQTAAAMIRNRGTLASSNASAGSQESSSFKSFKENLNKPTIAGLGGILGIGGNEKKSNSAFGGKQSGPQSGAKNQTFGADVNRAGVPRRTGGG